MRHWKRILNQICETSVNTRINIAHRKERRRCRWSEGGVTVTGCEMVLWLLGKRDQEEKCSVNKQSGTHNKNTTIAKRERERRKVEREGISVRRRRKPQRGE